MAEPSSRRHDSRIEEAKRAIDRKWALVALTGKIPVHKGWQKKERATWQEVEKWLCKGRNLGVRTGQVSGIVVIDDDSVDGSASRVLGLPDTVTAITGSGKKHYYFKAPDFTVGNSVKTLAPGIDVRGDGGQVVLVGSIHPDTKQPYCWMPGHSPDEIELATLPDAILVKLRRAKSNGTTFEFVKGAPTAENVEDKRVRAYVNAAIADEFRRVYLSLPGARNDTLNKAAFALGQLVGAGVVERELIVLALRSAASAAGLKDTEIDKTIASGIDAGIKEPRDVFAAVMGRATSSLDASTEDDDRRPMVILYPGHLPTSVSKAEDVLLHQNPPLIYQRGTTLVRIVSLPVTDSDTSTGNKPIIQEVNSHFLIDALTSQIAWRKVERKSGDLYPVDCPERVALTLLNRSGAWSVPPLNGVIDCPTLRRDGEVLAREGYDRESGLYVTLGTKQWPTIPLRPTLEDARAALAKIHYVLKDFPFVGAEDRSVAEAAILTALIRPALRTAPLFSFQAAKMGSGKSLLADVVSLIATGRAAAVMSQGADENEDKKRFLPILAEGDPVAVIDNIERPFGSPALCSILTQTVWRDRLLGKSQTLTLPTTNTTWIATGNNIRFVGDITTRVLVCDLDPQCERPEERRFEINLHQYVPRHREELVVAGLTILRAYHVAGRPDMKLSVFGRFEEWSDLVRSALVWLGEADPCSTRRRAEEADSVRIELAALLTALHGRYGSDTFQVADVLADADRDAALRDAILVVQAGVRGGTSPRQQLGMFFLQYARRLEGGLRLVRGDSTRNGSATWRVERV